MNFQAHTLKLRAWIETLFNKVHNPAHDSYDVIQEIKDYLKSNESIAEDLTVFRALSIPIFARMR